MQGNYYLCAHKLTTVSKVLAVHLPSTSSPLSCELHNKCETHTSFPMSVISAFCIYYANNKSITFVNKSKKSKNSTSLILTAATLNFNGNV